MKHILLTLIALFTLSLSASATELKETFYIKYYGNNGSGVLHSYKEAQQIITDENLAARVIVKEVNKQRFIYIRFNQNFETRKNAIAYAKDLHLLEYFVQRSVNK